MIENVSKSKQRRGAVRYWNTDLLFITEFVIGRQ